VKAVDEGKIHVPVLDLADWLDSLSCGGWVVSRKRSISTTPLWIITLLGIGVTAGGIYIQGKGASATQQMVAGTLAAVGGGVIGAVISIFFSAGEGRDTLFAVRDLLAGSLRARMRSAEEDLGPIRHEWHYYHLTERDGEYLWRYTHYHFEQSNTTGSIVLLIKDTSFGREHIYRSEVAVRGDRMILVEAPEDGSEPPIVTVVPFFTEEFRKARAGISFLRTWDGTDILSKCLWSKEPLVAAEGDDVRPEDAPKLEELWARNFRNAHRIFPAAQDSTQPMPSQQTGQGTV
jgi:hypothetical protein